MISSSANFNPILSQLASEWWNISTGWAGHVLAPVFRTGEQSGQYPVFDKENLLRLPTNIVRAPGTAYGESGLQLSDDTYNCTDKGHAVPLDDSQVRKYRNLFDVEVAAIRRAMRVVRYNHELAVKAIVDDGSVGGATPSTKWDAASSTPIADVRAQRDAMRDASGLDPNTMILTRKVADELFEHPDLVDKFKYSQVAVLGAEDIARVFRIPNVVIAGEYADTGAEGLTANIAEIWGDTVVLAYTSGGNDLEMPNACRTFVWTEDSGAEDDIDVVVESFRDENIRSDKHRVRHHTDVKKTGAALIRKLTDCLT